MTAAPCRSSAGCRHRQFESARGDFAHRVFSTALRVALERSGRRGRQRVTRHVSWRFTRGVWFVQDVDAPAVTR